MKIEVDANGDATPEITGDCTSITSPAIAAAGIRAMIEACARAAHEACRAYDIALGLPPALEWSDTSFQKSLRLATIGVLNGNRPPKSSVPERDELLVNVVRAVGAAFGCGTIPDFRGAKFEIHQTVVAEAVPDQVTITPRSA